MNNKGADQTARTFLMTWLISSSSRNHGLSLFNIRFVNRSHIWAASWQNQQMACAPSEDSDQPGHASSLIRVFVVRMKKAWVLSYPLSAQQRGWSDWANALADLSLRWAHVSFCLFCHEAAHIWLFSARRGCSLWLWHSLEIFSLSPLAALESINDRPIRVSEEDFWRFLPYMDMAAILVMWLQPFQESMYYPLNPWNPHMEFDFSWPSGLGCLRQMASAWPWTKV